MGVVSHNIMFPAWYFVVAIKSHDLVHVSWQM